MRSARALAALPIAFACAGSSAQAADVSPAAALSAKVDGAIAAATSYRIAVEGPNGLSLDIREFGADRVRIVSNTAGTASETIVIGDRMYYRGAGSAWKTYPVPPVKHMRKNRLYMGAPDTLLDPLPDRTEGSETLGAFRSAAVGNAELPGTMECTYDKSTYRPRDCSIMLHGWPSPLRATYAGWNDPMNAVETPADAPVVAATPKPGGLR